MDTPLLGKVVKPKYHGGKYDYSVYRGRLVDAWDTAAPEFEGQFAVGLVVWFGAAKRDLGKTSQYRLWDLELA